MSDSISLLIADDHELVRLALQHSLGALTPEVQMFTADDALTTRACLAEHANAGTPINVALVDWRMPGIEGVEWFTRLITDFPSTRVVVMSGAEDATRVRELLSAGAAGFIPKTDSAAVILQAMRLVLAGGTYAPVRLLSTDAEHSSDSDASATKRPSDTSFNNLTGRQLEVLRLLARGLPNKLIARELGLSEGTVKVHILAIFRTLSVNNRTEAVIAASKFLALRD
jgi:DNA-binding NarL/FixJ family response regulator